MAELTLSTEIYNCLRVTPGQRLLDAGGADTPGLAQLTGPAGEVIGLGEDDDRLVVAEMDSEIAGVSGWVRHEQGILTELTYPDHYFDAVYCGEDVTYANDLAQMMAEFGRVLKPGGYLAVHASDAQTARDWFINADFFQVIVIPSDKTFVVGRKK